MPRSYLPNTTIVNDAEIGRTLGAYGRDQISGMAPAWLLPVIVAIALEA